MREQARRIFSWLLVLALGMPQAALARTEFVGSLEVEELTSYAGQVEDGVRSGFGISRRMDGSVYFGEYAQGKISGVGVITYVEEGKTDLVHRSGIFLDSQADGEGVVLKRDGARETANYEMGEVVPGSASTVHGSHEWKAHLKLPDGATYMGEVETGTHVPDGYGVRLDADGGVYAGAFAAGKRSGRGIYMDAYHNSVSGVWEDDLALQAVRTVYVDDKHPLDWVFKAEAGGAAPSRLYEGEGWNTPEEAVQTFLDGLMKLDLRQMVSVFAIETYVEHYDFRAWLDLTRGYHFTFEIPYTNANDFFQSINVEKRKDRVVEGIHCQFWALYFPEIEYSRAIFFRGNNGADSQEFVERMNTALAWGNWSFAIGEFVDPALLIDGYTDPHVQEDLAAKAKIYGADELKSMAVRISIDGQPYLFCCDAVRYGDKWYLSSLPGAIGYVLGSGTQQGGLIPWP